MQGKDVTFSCACVGCGHVLHYETAWEAEYYRVCKDCIGQEPQPDSIKYSENPEL